MCVPCAPGLYSSAESECLACLAPAVQSCPAAGSRWASPLAEYAATGIAAAANVTVFTSSLNNYELAWVDFQDLSRLSEAMLASLLPLGALGAGFVVLACCAWRAERRSRAARSLLAAIGYADLYSRLDKQRVALPDTRIEQRREPADGVFSIIALLLGLMVGSYLLFAFLWNNASLESSYVMGSHPFPDWPAVRVEASTFSVGNDTCLSGAAHCSYSRQQGAPMVPLACESISFTPATGECKLVLAKPALKYTASPSFGFVVPAAATATWAVRLAVCPPGVSSDDSASGSSSSSSCEAKGTHGESSCVFSAPLGELLSSVQHISLSVDLYQRQTLDYRQSQSHPRSTVGFGVSDIRLSFLPDPVSVLDPDLALLTTSQLSPTLTLQVVPSNVYQSVSVFAVKGLVDVAAGFGGAVTTILGVVGTLAGLVTAVRMSRERARRKLQAGVDENAVSADSTTPLLGAINGEDRV